MLLGTMVLLTGLAGCAPQPGEPGSNRCDPITVGFDCTVWDCWVVEDDRTVTHEYRWGADLEQSTRECVDPLGCADELETAKQRACNGQA